MIIKDYKFMNSLADKLITNYEFSDICEFILNNRMLPKNVSKLPGPYRFDVFPYHREILETMSPFNPTRETTVMKGVQTGFTTVAENLILYYAMEAQGTPCMWITAQFSLAEERRDVNIIPMLNESGFEDAFESLDTRALRASGKGRNLLQFKGGSVLYFRGGSQKSVNTARQQSAQVIVLDESSGFGKNDTDRTQGNLLDLFKSRASAFWDSRKVLTGSTPLRSPDNTEDSFKKGDQRYYHVNCLGCSEPQVLRFSHEKNKKKIGGLVWDLTDKGELLPDSVRYKCPHCGHLHTEFDKTRLFSNENAKWVPHNPLESEEFKSYHLSALYSPCNFQPWHKCVQMYLDSWDHVSNSPKDRAKYQVFVNNILGEVFTFKTSPIKHHMVSGLRRDFYNYGQIPNNRIKLYNDHGIAFLVATVDVHGDRLLYSVWGFTSNNCAYLIKYKVLAGETEATDENWQELEKELTEIYISDDGYAYNIPICGIDSGWNTNLVISKCVEYNKKYLKEYKQMIPIKGFGENQQKRVHNYKISEHKELQDVFTANINVDYYKDLLSNRITNEFGWDGVSQQDPFTVNLPFDATDKQIAELTAETKEMKIVNGKEAGEYWYRKPGVDNELWDLLVYAQSINDHIINELRNEIMNVDKHKKKDISYQEVFQAIYDETLPIEFRKRIEGFND